MPTELEYRVIPTTRYLVTRYATHPSGACGASSQVGEYDNAKAAYDVAYACCKVEHDALGYPINDDRVQYPREVGQVHPALAGIIALEELSGITHSGTVAVKVAGRITDETAEKIRAKWQDMMPNGVKVIVHDDSASLAVVPA